MLARALTILNSIFNVTFETSNQIKLTVLIPPYLNFKMTNAKKKFIIFNSRFVYCFEILQNLYDSVKINKQTGFERSYHALNFLSPFVS